MKRKMDAASVLVCAFAISLMIAPLARVAGWSNGGYTTAIDVPAIGTHDWIANNSLGMLPDRDCQYIKDNMEYFYYGTELPDNPGAILGDGIGDTTNHHVYFNLSGACYDQVGGNRAAAMYALALNNLTGHDYRNASKWAGAMTHYIADLAVFGHVMAAATPWGAEVHHSDYESYVLNHPDYFQPYVTFDGSLPNRTALNASVTMGHDTTFDDSGNNRTCVWMDDNYDWSDPAYVARCGQAQNLVINLIADVLHTLAWDAGYTPVSVFDIPVVLGWNLVSLPLMPQNSTLPSAINDLDNDTLWDRIMWYNPTDADNNWRQYNANWPETFNELLIVNHTFGIWINISTLGDGVIRISGALPGSTTIHLKTGWNLVGYPASDDETYSVSQLKASTSASIVEGFNQTQLYKIAPLSDDTILKRGMAYWVQVPADSVWTVDW